jgi:hypothetical protein
MLQFIFTIDEENKKKVIKILKKTNTTAFPRARQFLQKK